MKKTILKFSLGLIIAGYTCNAYSQLDDVTKVLNGGVADANTLMKAYAEPMGKGFALSLTNGWYNTASVHSTLGFDITLSAGMANAPSSLQTYDATKLGLTALKVSGTNSIGQTISGSKEDGPTLIPKTQVNEKNLPGFTMPAGLGVNFVPMAQIQGALGLPFGNEIIVRFMPTVKLNISSFNMKFGSWGVGIKHDIKQWIPVVNNVPFWSLSALVSYSKFTSSSSVSLLPDVDMYYNDQLSILDWTGQNVELNSSALMLGIQASTNIPVINVYGGLGLVSASSNIKMTGNYPIPTMPSETEAINRGSVKFLIDQKNAKDPIDLKFSSKTAFRANIGLRLKLALLTIHGDISTCDSYFLYSAGIGISFR
jgi:hypothetical protein